MGTPQQGVSRVQRAAHRDQSGRWDCIERPSQGFSGRVSQVSGRAPAVQRAANRLHKNLRPNSTNNTRDEFIANLEKESAGNFVKLCVEPEARNYTISIPATKQQRIFEIKMK